MPTVTAVETPYGPLVTITMYGGWMPFDWWYHTRTVPVKVEGITNGNKSFRDLLFLAEKRGWW